MKSTGLSIIPSAAPALNSVQVILEINQNPITEMKPMLIYQRHRDLLLRMVKPWGNKNLERGHGGHGERIRVLGGTQR